MLVIVFCPVFKAVTCIGGNPENLEIEQLGPFVIVRIRLPSSLFPVASTFGHKILGSPSNTDD